MARLIFRKLSTANLRIHRRDAAGVNNPVINTYYNPNGESAVYADFANRPMSCMLLILLTGRGLVRERERGNNRAFAGDAGQSFELMMGKVLANAAVIWVAALSSCVLSCI